MSPINDKAAFFAVVPTLSFEIVDVPGLGSLRVSQISVGARDRFEAAATGQGISDVRTLMLIATLVDENGRPLFDASDFDRLSNLPASLVEPLIEAAARLNAVSDKDVEELAKN